MNRSQRRRAEKERRRNEIRLTPDRIKEIKQDVTQKAINQASEDLMTCFIWALHKRDGFGAKRIFEVLYVIDEEMGKVNADPDYMDELKQKLKDEVGVIIKY